jgi:hypothetical protein
MKQADLMDLGFDMFDSCDSFESTKIINPKSMRTKGKITLINGLKQELLSNLLGRLPEESEYIHLISNGKYDYYTFIPTILNHVGHIDEFWGSTWTMNRANLEDLFNLFDSGKIDTMNIITGLFFKRRETSVYATLVEGMVKRGQKYISCENHAKILLIRSGEKYYVVEGSANWTANPRIEQNMITQSKELYNFHKGWMQEYIG